MTIAGTTSLTDLDPDPEKKIAIVNKEKIVCLSPIQIEEAKTVERKKLSRSLN